MKTFKFRLQKVLEYREAMEQYAQNAYLDSRLARLEADAELLNVDDKRKAMIAGTGNDLSERLALEAKLIALADEEREKQIVAHLLTAEEEKALQNWHEKKRELDALVKLRDRALEEYLLDGTRREQAELDEWAVLRRQA